MDSADRRQAGRKGGRERVRAYLEGDDQLR